MAGKRITIQLQGSPADAGHVQLGIFIKQLEAVREALIQTELMETGGKHPSVYYRIVDLSHDSPATITLEATPIRQKSTERVGQDYSRETVTAFVKNLSLIQRRKAIPNDIDVQTLLAYRRLGVQLGDDLADIMIRNGRRKISIDASFNTYIDQVIGPDEIAEGAISGLLEAVNLHDKRVFHIYPVAGPSRLRCHFSPEHLATVKGALEKHVRVHGEMRYKQRDRFPYAVIVESIDVLPDDNSLPTFESLRGIMPDSTNGVSSEEFIERLRDENW